MAAAPLAGVFVRVAQRLLALAACLCWNWQIGAPVKLSLIADDHERAWLLTFERLLSLAGRTDMIGGTGVVASSGRDWRGWITTGERFTGRVASSAWVPRRSV